MDGDRCSAVYLLRRIHVHDIQQYHPLKNVRIEIQYPNQVQLLFLSKRPCVVKKAKLITRLIARQAMKTCEKRRNRAMHFFTSAPDGLKWSTSSHGLFTTEEGATDTHWTEGTVRPRNALDAGTSYAWNRTLIPRAYRPKLSSYTH
jgi:hypothetical protein